MPVKTNVPEYNTESLSPWGPVDEEIAREGAYEGSFQGSLMTLVEHVKAVEAQLASMTEFVNSLQVDEEPQTGKRGR